jgi:hypothetical protein
MATCAVLTVLNCGSVQAAPIHALSPQSSESQNDLRQENDRLAQQVRSLQGDLDAAQKRIKELEDRLAKLEQGGGLSAPNAKPPEPVAPDPALGPGGLLSKLRNDYMDAFQTKDIPTNGPGADPASQQAWTLHERALSSWIARAQKGVMDVQWVGTINPTSVEQRGRDVALELVFDNGGREFRNTVVIDQGMMSRLRGPDGSPTRGQVSVNAIVTPKLSVNSAKFEAGPFERPPLVGPYLEFGYELRPKVILPVERARPTPAKAPDKSAPPSS